MDKNYVTKAIFVEKDVIQNKKKGKKGFSKKTKKFSFFFLKQGFQKKTNSKND